MIKWFKKFDVLGVSRRSDGAQVIRVQKTHISGRKMEFQKPKGPGLVCGRI